MGGVELASELTNLSKALCKALLLLNDDKLEFFLRLTRKASERLHGLGEHMSACQ